MRLSVVVPTLDRPDHLEAHLPVVRAQLRPGDELIVVDQSGPPARDRAAAVARRVGAQHLLLSAAGLPEARNAGVAHTTAPGVVFLDDDAWPLPGWLDAHRAALSEPGVGAVAGRVIEARLRPNARGPCNGLDLGGRVRVDLGTWAPGDVETVKGCNAGFRRQALVDAGPCDAGFRGTAFLEDADWSTRVRRAGWTLRWAPDAAVVHHSAPRGGCRADPVQAERWRFHNTGRFVRRHRPWTAPLSVLTFAAVASRRAAEWRDPSAAARLLAAWWRGFREAG